MFEVPQLAQRAQHLGRDRLRLEGAVLVDARVDAGGPPLAHRRAGGRVLGLAVPVQRVLADVGQRDGGHDAVAVGRGADEAEVDFTHHERGAVVPDHLLDRPADDAEQLVLGVVEPGQDARVIHEPERVGLAPVHRDLLPVHGHRGALRPARLPQTPRARYHRPRMHTLLFLEPGHFHATLTLREPNPRVSPEIFVYSQDGPESPGPELRDFLALVERFNARAERPTRWRPVVVTSDDPLVRLIAERRGDVVVLAGRNGGKARTFRRLHEAGFHVLADKPWLVEPEDLADVRASLGGLDPPVSPGWPLTMEIMTGRHDVAARLFKRLVDSRELFGDFRAGGPAIELASVHHLEKLVDGAPLRRPAWYFDVRVQGGGAVDISTHVVDQTQWLMEDRGLAPGEMRLDSARQWATPVPLEAFS